MKNIYTICKQIKWINIAVIYLRYLIGGAFVFSAMPKILGQRFLTSNCESAPIDTFPHLFETLYRSGIYWEFLGWGQLIAALLLMTQRFSTLGAVIFMPIIMNIFMITYAYHFGGTTVIVGLMLLANLFLLVWDFDKLQILLLLPEKQLLNFTNPHSNYFHNKLWSYLGFIIFFTSVCYVLKFGRNPTAWFLICVTEGLIGLIYQNIRFRKPVNQSN